MTQRNSKVVDGDWNYQREQIMADQPSAGRDWDEALRDEYLAAEHGIATPEDLDTAITANEIDNVSSSPDLHGDRELEGILRLAGVRPQPQIEGADR